MKKIITLILFISICQISVAQNWIQKNNTLTAASGSSTFAIGDTGYVVAGSQGFTFYTNTWMYDTLADSWATEANYPGVGGGVKVGFSLDGMGYVGTGTAIGCQWYNQFYQYNPNDDTWTQEANFAGLPRGYAVAFVLDGKGYVGLGVGSPSSSCGGTNFHAYKDFYAYDPSNNMWTQIANYPGKGSQLNISFVIGDKAYVGCGETEDSSSWSSTAVDSDFWEYDTTSKVWTRIANFAGGPRAAGTGFSTCGNGFVGLGFSDLANSDYMNDFWQYNPSNNTWTQIANYGGAGRELASSFIINNSAWVGMGSNNSGSLQDWWEYHVVHTPAFSADTFVCQGGSVTFTDTSTFNPDHWNWQFPGGTPDTSTQLSATITYDTAGYHDVVLTAWNSCDSATETFTNYIHVGTGGVLTFYPSDTPIVCNGQSITLSVTNDLGGTFTWTPGAALIDSSQSADSVMAAPSITTTYSISGTGTGGCGYAGTVTITVNSTSTFNISPLDTAFCNGQSAILYVSGGGSNFIWTPTSGITDSTLSGDSIIISPTLTTTYTVIGINTSNCASSGTDVVTIIPSPGTPTFTQDGDTLISSSVHDNQWYRNDSLLADDTSQYFVINIPGEYYVVVTNEVNGCSTSSDSMQIKTGIDKLSITSSQLSIYPNPFSNEVFININNSAEDISDWNLQVIDMLGRTVYNQQSLSYSNTIDLSNLPGGVYFLTVINKTGKAVVPVVKQ